MNRELKLILGLRRRISSPSQFKDPILLITSAPASTPTFISVPTARPVFNYLKVEGLYETYNNLNISIKRGYVCDNSEYFSSRPVYKNVVEIDVTSADYGLSECLNSCDSYNARRQSSNDLIPDKSDWNINYCNYVVFVKDLRIQCLIFNTCHRLVLSTDVDINTHEYGTIYIKPWSLTGYVTYINIIAKNNVTERRTLCNERSDTYFLNNEICITICDYINSIHNENDCDSKPGLCYSYDGLCLLNGTYGF